VKFDASHMMSADSEGYRRGSNTKHAVLVLSGLVAGTSNIEVPISFYPFVRRTGRVQQWMPHFGHLRLRTFGL
jgi:hypothetical protein